MQIRNSINKVPAKWTPIIYTTKSGRTEQHYRCPIIGYALFDPLPRRCTVHYRKSCIKINHKCSFTLPQMNDPDFPHNFQVEIPNIEEAYEKICHALAYLSAKLDISANKICSNDMSIFISHIISIGKQLTSKNSAFEDSNLFTISNTQFGETLGRVSDKIESKMIRIFSEDINFANLLADTGTTNKLCVQQFVLSNPNFPLMRYPHSNFENINFDNEQYAAVFQEAIENAISNGINIVSIIADSQAAQTKGIIKLLSTHENPIIKAIVHIPCVSHMVNRVFAELLNSDLFDEMLHHIDLLSELCRSPEGLNIIGKSCPTAVETRWFYIVEILIFFIDNAHELANLCTIKEVDLNFDEICDTYFILHPLYKLSLKIEDRSTSLSMLLPLIDLTLTNLKENASLISTDFGKKVFTEVSTNFLARMLSLPFPIIQAAFALSPDGRNAIRKKERNYSTMGAILDNYPSASDPASRSVRPLVLDIPAHEPIELTPVLRQLIQNIEENEIELESAQLDQIDEEMQQHPESDKTNPDQIEQEKEEEAFDEVSYSDFPSEEIEENEISLKKMVENASDLLLSTRGRFKRYCKIKEQLSLIPIEERLFIDLYDNIVPNTTSFLKEQANFLNLKSDIGDLIQKWLFAEFTNDFIQIKENESMNDYWRRIHQFNEFKDLATLGIRLASIGVSEAEVERIFSVQKRIMGQNTFNMGTKTLHNRLILRYSWFSQS